jgi:hypothetical protein
VVNWFDFVILSLATFRLSRFITKDIFFEWLREGIWKRFPPSTTFGYLFTCSWCLSIWFASLFTACYTIEPTVTVYVALPFALSTVAGLISSRLDG